jgi:hypothetical protein
VGSCGINCGGIKASVDIDRERDESRTLTETGGQGRDRGAVGSRGKVGTKYKGQSATGTQSKDKATQ